MVCVREWSIRSWKKNMENSKCLIYCRVSSERQVNEGHGLDSQEKRCRDYAIGKGYKVVGIFRDEGKSGGLFERPAMKELLSELEKYIHEPTNTIVVFDDLKRFARDTQVHFQLKKEIYGRNGSVESPNFKFEDTPEGKFVETVLAAQAELERNQNRKQVIQKQKARLELGYWSFCPPLGLVSKKDQLHGKLLVSNEPYAGIYRQAIELFADESLLTIDDVKQFINNKFELTGTKKRLSFNGARLVLTQILYAGYIEYKPWEVSRTKGHHEGLVSIETFDKVQERLSGNKKHGVRKDYHPDFPLRQLILCSKCNKPLTGSWNKGRNKRYANYTCKTKGCSYRYKSIHADDVVTNFENLLTVSKPTNSAVDLAKAVLDDVWMQRRASSNEIIEANTSKLIEIDKSLEKLKMRLVKTSDDFVSVYEGEIKKLIIEKESLEKIKVSEYSDSEFGTAKDLVLETLKNPMMLWGSDNGEDKRTIFNMYFGRKLIYDKDSGFGTADLDPVIGLITSPTASTNQLVEMVGIEPTSEKLKTKLLQAYLIYNIFFEIGQSTGKLKVRLICL